MPATSQSYRRLADLELRRLLMLLTLAAVWFTPASESLLAGDHTTTQSEDVGDLPTPAENLEAPVFPGTPEMPEASNAIATDKQSQEPDPSQTDPNTESQPQQQYFVAAPMSALTVDVSFPSGPLPTNVAAEYSASTTPLRDSRLQGDWTISQQHWSATCQRHRPLYFEEAGAERYGYTPAYCLQPLISAGHFFLTIPTLPYKMAVDCPRDCDYTLGHDRPGSCGPWRRDHFPCHAGAALAETAAIAGLILLIP